MGEKYQAKREGEIDMPNGVVLMIIKTA